MNIPLVDLRKQYAPLKDEILRGIGQALDGMHLFLGENVQCLEKEFAGFCRVRHGVGVSDGTAALHIILRAMGIGQGDDRLPPDFSHEHGDDLRVRAPSLRAPVDRAPPGSGNQRRDAPGTQR